MKIQQNKPLKEARLECDKLNTIPTLFGGPEQTAPVAPPPVGGTGQQFLYTSVKIAQNS